MSPEHLEVGDRKKWLLVLLATPNTNGKVYDIYGRTRIMKAAFLLARKLDSVLHVDTDFNFEPYRYGPYDRGVFVALENLEDEGKITTEETEEHNGKYEGTKYAVTETGRKEGLQRFKELSEEEQRLCRWVKYKQAMRSTSALLSYVYMNYPDMTTESELVSS